MSNPNPTAPPMPRDDDPAMIARDLFLRYRAKKVKNYAKPITADLIRMGHKGVNATLVRRWIAPCLHAEKYGVKPIQTKVEELAGTVIDCITGADLRNLKSLTQSSELIVKAAGTLAARVIAAAGQVPIETAADVKDMTASVEMLMRLGFDIQKGILAQLPENAQTIHDPMARNGALNGEIIEPARPASPMEGAISMFQKGRPGTPQH
jgi:hypothetical protein